MAEEEKVKNPPVLIVGTSGDGKSSMFGKNEHANIKGLPPERTIILNVENKLMPFDNVSKFKVVNITSYKTLKTVLGQLMGEGGSKYDYVVFDSLTSATELINSWAEFAHQGFEQWKQYNAAIFDILMTIKKLPQQVFVVGIPETKDMSFNNVKEFFKVKGNEHKYGGIEKEFSIVLYTMPIYDEDTGEVKDVKLQYKPNKKNSAKAPVGLFKDYPRNDAHDVVVAIRTFYGIGGAKKESSDTTD